MRYAWSAQIRERASFSPARCACCRRGWVSPSGKFFCILDLATSPSCAVRGEELSRQIPLTFACAASPFLLCLFNPSSLPLPPPLLSPVPPFSRLPSTLGHTAHPRSPSLPAGDSQKHGASVDAELAEVAARRRRMREECAPVPPPSILTDAGDTTPASAFPDTSPAPAPAAAATAATGIATATAADIFAATDNVEPMRTTGAAQPPSPPSAAALAVATAAATPLATTSAAAANSPSASAAVSLGTSDANSAAAHTNATDGAPGAPRGRQDGTLV